MSKKNIILVLCVIAVLCCGYLWYCFKNCLVEQKPFSEMFQKDVKTFESEYFDDDNNKYYGYWSMPKNAQESLPGILLIHEWTGLGDYIKMRTRKISSEGYVAFAIDLYGSGKHAANHLEAKILMQDVLNNRDRMQKNLTRTLEILKNSPYVISDRLAAIGYCFGGDAILEIALMGRSDVHALVSFHGMLEVPNLLERMSSTNVTAELMFHHGEKDPFISAKVITSLHNVLQQNNVQYQFFVYLDAYHGFTRGGAGENGEIDIIGSVLYNQDADEKSYERTIQFLSEKLKR